MAEKLTRAERYKRNYRIVKNAYQNSTLAKRAQTWSDERLYNELGVKVEVKTPTLKTATKRQVTSAKRKLDHFIYARDLGMSVEDSRKVTKYKKSKIESTYEYLETKTKRFTTKNKIKRMDLWSEWSRGLGNMPPEVERLARERNRETIVGGKQLDDYSKYGYIVAFYMFVENKPLNEIQDLIKPDPHDSYRVIYKTMVQV